MLGIRIKSLRKEHGWNQTELAEKIGVGRTTITEYECERINPPYDKIVMMAELFGVSVNYLTGVSNSKTETTNKNVDDIAEQLSYMIDTLNQKDYSVMIDGVQIDIETKNVVAGQLEQSLRMIRYLNKMNKGEQ